MECNKDRIQLLLDTLATFNATPELGVTRFSYSEQDSQARAFLMEKMQAMGLRVTVDAVGNIRGQLAGRNPEAPAVLTGSHIDTVFHGGKFDGAVGVVCALEVLQTLTENHLRGEAPVEIIIFAEEEGSNFTSTMAGSKALVGKYTLEDLKTIKDAKGSSMYEVLKANGYNPDALAMEQQNLSPIQALIEMHVEQGGILDAEGKSIGIVQGIYGSKCLEVVIHGEANHAGATPMYLRHDPMVAAASIILAVDQAASRDRKATTVATVGKIKAFPDVSNCIAKEVVFTIDIRDIEEAGIQRICTVVETAIAKAQEHYGVTIACNQLAKSGVVKLSEEIVNVLEEETKILGYDYRLINSGAVHDAAMLRSLTKVGMIFVPSIGGKSHVPEEDSRIDDIKNGADLLLASICKLASIQA